MFASLILTELYFTLRYWHIRQGLFRHLQSAGCTKPRTSSSPTRSGMIHIGGGGLILGEVVGRGIGLRRLTRSAWSEIREQVTTIAVKQLTMSLPSTTFSALFMALYASRQRQCRCTRQPHGNILWLVGRRSVRNRVSSSPPPMALIGGSVADVFHNRIAEYSRTDPSSAQRFFRQVAVTLFVIGFVPTLIVACTPMTSYPISSDRAGELPG